MPSVPHVIVQSGGHNCVRILFSGALPVVRPAL